MNNALKLAISDDFSLFLTFLLFPDFCAYVIRNFEQVVNSFLRAENRLCKRFEYVILLRNDLKGDYS